jgi:hypothetical protein
MAKTRHSAEIANLARSSCRGSRMKIVTSNATSIAHDDCANSAHMDQRRKSKNRAHDADRGCIDFAKRPAGREVALGGGCRVGGGPRPIGSAHSLPDHHPMVALRVNCCQPARRYG